MSYSAFDRLLTLGEPIQRMPGMQQRGQNVFDSVVILWSRQSLASRWLMFLALSAFMLYVGLALTPSSYGSAFDMLGLQRQGFLLGNPRGIRSDEWMVFTPYVQIAVANGFGPVNLASPYHEDLRSFQSLPILDWALLFKPYHWGFMLLPAANAYAFYFASLTAAFITGWALFMRQLRVPAVAAGLVSVTLYFSPFVQVWWTSNAGAFALAPWAALAWLYFERRWVRIVLSTYALAVWLLACAYPPFLYSAGLAMAILVFALRRDKLTGARLFDATIAGAIALSLFIFYFHDLIDIIQNTVYPGRRESAGGGTEWAKLFAHLGSGLTTYRFEPLAAFSNSNACEIAVMSSLLPMYTLLLNRHNLALWMDRHQAAAFIFLSGTVFIACWIFLPMPAVVAKITGLFMVPPQRALLALGLLVNIGCAILIANCGVQLSLRRLALLAAVTLAATAMKYFVAGGTIIATYSLLDVIPYVCVATLLVGRLLALPPARGAAFVLFTAMIGNILAYGTFNPIQSATPIFAVDKTEVQRLLSERGATTSPEGYLVAPGHYGALLAGIGLPSINHVLYYPQPAFFKRYFGELPKQEFDEVFNRYAHVSIGAGTLPRVLAPDHIQVPAAVMLGTADATSENVAAVERQGPRPPPVSADVPIGHVDSVGPILDGRLTLQGWFHAPLNRDTRILVWTSTEQVQTALSVIQRPDVAKVVASDLLDSGFALTIEFGPATTSTEVCIQTQDTDNRVTTVRFPNGDLNCTRLPYDTDGPSDEH